ncbi:hypothetical protein J4479_01405 [Candidatus Woesearchaeota archaeon]|nr:hypothetical protein [Candidatus Woesearchaeota archaeon]
MVKRIKNLFECEECNLWYNDQKTAQKCEQWCKAHHSCNLEIIQLSV